MKMLIFGDSIVWGAWDQELGWAYQLKKQLDKRTLESSFNSYNEVHVLGIPGDTTKNLLERFSFEVVARTSDGDKLLIIFAIGINDSILDIKTKKTKISLENFVQNIKKLIFKAKNYTPNILFLGLTPVDESRVNPIPWHLNGAYTTKHVEEFDRALKETCFQENAIYIDINQQISTMDLEDGVHPNTEGHRNILNSVKSSLEGHI